MTKNQMVEKTLTILKSEKVSNLEMKLSELLEKKIINEEERNDISIYFSKGVKNLFTILTKANDTKTVKGYEREIAKVNKFEYDFILTNIQANIIRVENLLNNYSK